MLCLLLLVTGCGAGGMSLTEYVDEVNAAVADASRAGEQLAAEAPLDGDPSPQLIQIALERSVAEIRTPLQEKVDALDPPDQVVELHRVMWEWHRDFIAVEQALAARAGAAEDTDAGWTALSESPEMNAYRAALVEGKRVCGDLQSNLDATEARGAFADNPWIPDDLKEVVDAALGCVYFPEHPEDVYRYPPPDPRQ